MAKEENALTLQVSSETRECLQKVADITGVKNLKTACEILIKVSWRPYIDKYSGVFGIGVAEAEATETLDPVSDDPSDEPSGGKESPSEGKESPSEGYTDLIDFSY